MNLKTYIKYSFGAGLAAITSLSFAAPFYTITEIGDPPVGATPRINDIGHISSRFIVGEDIHAALWEDGVFHELEELNNTPHIPYAYPNDLNNQGVVVGSSRIRGIRQPVIWQSGDIAQLDRLNSTHGDAESINDANQIVGQLFGDQFVRAVLWENEIAQYIAPNPSHALDINVSGVVVGAALQYGNTELTAFLWDDGVLTNLESLVVDGGSQATAINDLNQVVGDSDTSIPGVGRRAFLWESGEMIDLGDFGGGSSGAEDINGGGTIVGTARSPDSSNNAFIWTESEGMINLNTLIDLTGWERLTLAYGINETGQITGVGRRSDGSSSIFLLTPLEPEIIFVDNNAFCTGPVSPWIPIHGDIVIFIPGPGSSWELLTDASDKYGEDYYHLVGAENDGAVEFQWSFEVEYTANYEVDAWWPQNDNNTTSANYLITSSSGETLTSVQQNSNGGEWNSLGSFNFESGQTYHVKLSAPSGESVSADAIRIRI